MREPSLLFKLVISGSAFMSVPRDRLATATHPSETVALGKPTGILSVGN